MYWNEFAALLEELKTQGAPPALLTRLLDRHVVLYNDIQGTPGGFPVQFGGIQFAQVEPGKTGSARFPGVAEGKFVLVVTGAATRATSTQLGQDHVSSRFISGTRNGPNPEYDKAAKAVELAQNYADASESTLNHVGTANQVIGLFISNPFGGTAAKVAKANLMAAKLTLAGLKMKLALVPREIQVDDLADYSYVTSTINVHRQVDLTLFFWYPGAKVPFMNQISSGTDQPYQLAEGINPQDPQASAIRASMASAEDLGSEQWAPVTLDREALVALISADGWKPAPVVQDVPAAPSPIVRLAPPPKDVPGSPAPAAPPEPPRPQVMQPGTATYTQATTGLFASTTTGTRSIEEAGNTWIIKADSAKMQMTYTVEKGTFALKGCSFKDQGKSLEESRFGWEMTVVGDKLQVSAKPIARAAETHEVPISGTLTCYVPECLAWMPLHVGDSLQNRTYNAMRKKFTDATIRVVGIEDIALADTGATIKAWKLEEVDDDPILKSHRTLTTWIGQDNHKFIKSIEKTVLDSKEYTTTSELY